MYVASPKFTIGVIYQNLGPQISTVPVQDRRHGPGSRSDLGPLRGAGCRPALFRTRARVCPAGRRACLGSEATPAIAKKQALSAAPTIGPGRGPITVGTRHCKQIRKTRVRDLSRHKIELRDKKLWRIRGHWHAAPA